MRRILALTLLLATPAHALDNPYRLRVTPLGGPDFRVEFASGAEVTDYWCAAGAHVRQRLGLPGKTRIYRLSPPPRKRGQGISFTLDQARSSGSSGISTFGGVQDGGLSAGSAFQYCFDFRKRRFGFSGRSD
jgi:hypothetical protein